MVLIGLQILNSRIFKFSNHSSEVIIAKRTASPSTGEKMYDQFLRLQIEKMHHYFPVLSENMALLSSRQWVDFEPAADLAGEHKGTWEPEQPQPGQRPSTTCLLPWLRLPASSALQEHLLALPVDCLAHTLAHRWCPSAFIQFQFSWLGLTLKA